MIIDISQEVFSCHVYPGDPEPTLHELQNIEDGELYKISAFTMCTHNGTHVDAPAHFLKDGKQIQQIGLDSFVGECYVARHQGEVTKDDAEKILLKAEQVGAKDRILLAGNLVVSVEAAEIFAKANIKLLGNESQSVGPVEAPMAVHLILLKAEIVLLEGVILTDVEEGRYFLSAAPLNLSTCEGAPCRAYLIK